MGPILTKDSLSHIWAKLEPMFEGKVDKVDGKGVSTNDYTTAEKSKLSGLSNYTHPTTSGNKHIPAGGKSGQVVGWSADGTGTWVDQKDTTYNVVTDSAPGLMSAAEHTKLAGIAAGANNYSHPTYTAKTYGLYKVTVDGTGHVSGTAAVSKGDITALGIPDTNTTYNNATSSADGLMSKADKAKLDAFGAASTYATQTYVGQQISAGGHISKSIVESLPAVKDAKDNVIYMIKKTAPDGSNLYDEYMLISGALEKIGDTKTVIDEITNEEIDAILAS